MIRGSGFDNIPTDAVGLFAYENTMPLAYINAPSGNSEYIFTIVNKSDSEMVMKCENGTAHSVDNYLGGIVTADRQEVIWVNETQPLP